MTLLAVVFYDSGPKLVLWCKNLTRKFAYATKIT